MDEAKTAAGPIPPAEQPGDVDDLIYPGIDCPQPSDR